MNVNPAKPFRLTNKKPLKNEDTSHFAVEIRSQSKRMGTGTQQS
jgi:hypothetical protein